MGSDVLPRIARIARTIVVAPPLVGVAYVVALAVWAGTSANAVDADVGDVRRTAAMETFINRRFPSELLRMKVGVLAVAVAFGVLVGLAAEGLIRLRHPAERLAEQRTGRRFAETALLVFWCHGVVFAWAMADTPQLYAADWYAEGGLARTFQIFVTDVFGPRGTVVLAVLAAIAYVGPRRIVELARQIPTLARRPVANVAAPVAGRAGPLVLALALGAAAFGPQEAGIRAAHAGPAAPAAPPAASSSAPGSGGHPSSASAHGASPAIRGSGSGGIGNGGSGGAKPVNVLILAADSLRADHVDERRTPNLVRLADKGVRFDRAYVSLPRTFPSWVTILTGRHGHHHGVRSMFPTWEDRAKDFDALPARFGRSGFATGVVSDYAGDIFGRIDLGFSRIDTPSFDFRQMIRQKVLERETPLLPLLHSHLGRKMFPVMRELAAAADPMLLADDVESALRATRDKPFFLTVFFSTAHFPYAAPAPYYAKYTDSQYRGRFKYHKPMGLGRASEVPPDAEDIRQIQALYDGAVTAVDDAVGRVLHSLERAGLADRTVILVTADHGEAIFDHGHGQGHGDHLFGDEGNHVPFILYDPRATTHGRIDTIVRDVDIAPTLYELAGVPPPADLDGKSVAPALRGEPLGSRFAYAETELWFTEEIPWLPPELRIPYPGVMGLTELDSRHNAEIVLRKEMTAATLMARHRMIRDERWKLVYVPTRGGVRWMLFDTAGDREEAIDVAAAHPAEVARLRAELWRWMLEDPLMEQRDGFLVPREGALRGSK